MNITAIRTPIFRLKQNLVHFIIQHTKNDIKENTILAITSKIVSLSENRLLSKKNIDKKTLIKKECTHYLGQIQMGYHLTIHHNLLIPSAGIDESNSENKKYILYPKNPFLSAKKLLQLLKKQTGLKNLGVIITDSRTFPLRRGVLGVALAYSGFKGIKNCIGLKDLFGQKLKVTTINIVDALAASAVLLMGEGAQSTPLAVITKAPVVFTNKDDHLELNIPVKDDLYSPLYQHLL